MKTLALTVALLVPAVARAQVVVDMSPEAVAEAIGVGRAAAEAMREGRVPVLPGVCSFGCTPESLQVRTPFMRVAMAAYEATTKRLPFGPENVAADMLAPVVEVDQAGFLAGRSGVSYKHVVVATAAGAYVQPLRSESTRQAWTNAYGATAETRGVRATFPIAMLADGNEFRIIRDDGSETAEAITAKVLAGLR